MRIDSLFGSCAILSMVSSTPTAGQRGPVTAALPEAAVQTTPSPAARDSLIAFVDVSVIPLDSERVLPRYTVLVRGSHIVALGPRDQVRVPLDALRIDGRGKFLIPGLVDMHVHLGAGHVARFSEQDGTLIPRGQEKLRSFLVYGITTVRNLDMEGGFGAKVLRLRQLVAEGQVLGPRIYTSGRWRMFLSDTMSAKQYSATDDPAKVAPQIEAYKAAGYDFIKMYDFDGGVFDSLIAAARRAGLPVVGHVPPGISAERAIAGMSSIEHLDGYIADRFIGAKGEPTLEPGGPTGDERLHALAAATARANVWNTPTRYQLRGIARDGKPGQPDGPRFVKMLQDVGAGILAGSDGMTGERLHHELDFLVRAGLTPYQALVTATRNPAAYFGLSDSTGTVAVGKRADLVLLDGNPLDDIGQARTLTGVMLGGRWFDRATLASR